MNWFFETTESIESAMRDATGRAAAVLAEMLGCSVEMQLDSIQIVNRSQLSALLEGEIGKISASVEMGFTGEHPGSAYFILPKNNDQAIVNILNQQDPMLVSDSGGPLAVITEIGNVVLNMYTGTIVGRMGSNVVYETPQIRTEQQILERLLVSGDGDLRGPGYPILTGRMSISGLEVIVYILLAFRHERGG